MELSHKLETLLVYFQRLPTDLEKSAGVAPEVVLVDRTPPGHKHGLSKMLCDGPWKPQEAQRRLQEAVESLLDASGSRGVPMESTETSLGRSRTFPKRSCKSPERLKKLWDDPT